jgi:hypothetical protein
MLNVVNTFKIGADPEFMVINKMGNRHIDVSRIGDAYGSIGYDHGGCVIELRPAASYTVQELLKNIKVLLNDKRLAQFKEYTWRGGAAFRTSNDYGEMWVGMGGHIHLELPFVGHHGISNDVFNARIKALDAVSRILYELNILPKEENEVGRKAAGYGEYGAYKVAQSDNFFRIEYRTPCSWMFDPRNAFITLTALKLAVINPSLTMQLMKASLNKADMWRSLYKFFRAYRLLDSDARFALEKVGCSMRLNDLEKLKADPHKDFKPLWDSFKF